MSAKYHPVFFRTPPPQNWRERLSKIEVGRYADGQPWHLRIIDTHVLVAGQMGAGKGSVIWSTVVGLAPAIIAGVVQVWALDPKFMELALGREAFAQYAATPTAMVELIEQALEEMDRRKAALGDQKLRKFTPSVETPLIAIIIDEFGFLTALLSDRDLKKRAKQALDTLLTQGRAVGFSVMGALQDPRKETLDSRDLFPTRVAMRLTADMVNLVLGKEAYQQGAHCDRIPPGETGAGTAYVVDESDATPRRVRAYWVDDERVQTWAQSIAWSRSADHQQRQSTVADLLRQQAAITQPGSLPRLDEVEQRLAAWERAIDQGGNTDE